MEPQYGWVFFYQIQRITKSCPFVSSQLIDEQTLIQFLYLLEISWFSYLEINYFLGGLHCEHKRRANHEDLCPRFLQGDVLNAWNL